jgi:hypothetical protein
MRHWACWGTPPAAPEGGLRDGDAGLAPILCRAAELCRRHDIEEGRLLTAELALELGLGRPGQGDRPGLHRAAAQRRRAAERRLHGPISRDGIARGPHRHARRHRRSRGFPAPVMAHDVTGVLLPVDGLYLTR